MKPAYERFAQLMAGGRHTQVSAWIATYGEEKANKLKRVSAAANKLANKPLIQFRIKELQDEYALKAGVSADWIRNQLVDIVEGGGLANGTDKRGALDMLNKMSGNYEKDNEQKAAQISLKMEF